MGRRPHLIVIPFPAQGHIMPLMELSCNLVDQGFRVTFVNAELIHEKVVAALSRDNGEYEDFIHLVSIPDGVEAAADEDLVYQHIKLIKTMGKQMPGHLEGLIKKINESNNGEDRITCVIADAFVGWALEVAEKMSIPKAAVWTSSALSMAVNYQVPKLIEDGIITAEGNLLKNQMIKLSPTMPAMNTTQLWWLCHDPAFQIPLFNVLVENNRAVKLADYVLCNSFYELEPASFDLIPNLKPIGPISSSGIQLAHLWPEDSTCLSWLDQQPDDSVIYVAFGSTGVMDKPQFHELALGLELSGKSFLWVVRPDLMNDMVEGFYPDGFKARVGSRGKVVGWAPQREVLGHRSVSCFVSHCGWNSTMEGVSHGVPFLCWPYFSDQILNRNYICDVWKVGLGLNRNEDGPISREEIKTKIVGLLEDQEIKANALKLKETAMKSVDVGGKSWTNFEDFIQAIK